MQERENNKVEKGIEKREREKREVESEKGK
jgi:hypothetical protein